MSTTQRLATVAISAICVAYFAIWACAPVAHMRTAVPLSAGGSRMEVGAAGGARLRGHTTSTEDTIPLASLWLDGRFGDGSFRAGVVTAWNVGIGLGFHGGMRVADQLRLAGR